MGKAPSGRIMPLDEWAGIHRRTEAEYAAAKRVVDEIEAMARGERITASVLSRPGARR